MKKVVNDVKIVLQVDTKKNLRTRIIIGLSNQVTQQYR